MTDHFKRHARTEKKRKKICDVKTGNKTISAHQRIFVAVSAHKKDDKKSNKDD